jgi:hypothetical protein
MPDIGVRISADAIEFINAIKRVEKQTEDFRKSFETKMESVSSLAKKALGAFVAFQGLAGLREFTNSVDAIIKSSRALGESAEAFANIAGKASLAGISTEVLQTGLHRLQRALADAQSGSGEAADALAQLGMSADELIGLPLEEKLKKIVTAMQSLNQESREAVAHALFGRSGYEFLKLRPQDLEGGAGLMARTLGAIGETGRKQIEELNDSFTRMGGVAKSISTLIVASLAPAINAVATAVVNFTKFLLDNAAAVMTVIRTALAVAGAFLAWRAVIMTVTAAMAVYRAALLAVAAVKAFLVALTGPVGIALVATAVVASSLAVAAASQMGLFSKSAQESADNAKELAVAARQVADGAKGFATIAQVAVGTTRAAKDAAEAVKKIDDEMTKAFAERQKSAVLAVKLDVPKFAVDITQQFDDAQAKAEEKLRQIREAIAQVEAEFRRLEPAGQAAMRAMAGAEEPDEQTKAVLNAWTQVGGLLAKLREQERQAVAELAQLEQKRAQQLRIVAETEANKRIRELNEEVDKLLGKDFGRLLTQLQQAGAPQGAIEQLQFAMQAAEIAQVAKSARELGEELNRAALENELLARGFTQQEARLEILRRQVGDVRQGGFLDKERVDAINKAFADAAEAARRLGEATLLKDAADAVNRMREAASGIPPAFADAARNAALLDIALQKGLIGAQEHARLLEQLFAQVGQNIMQNFSQMRPIVKGSVEEARLLLQREAQGQARDIAREILPQLAQLARQQLEAQHRIARAVERQDAPRVVGP